MNQARASPDASHSVRSILGRHARAGAYSKSICDLQTAIVRQTASHPTAEAYFIDYQPKSAYRSYRERYGRPGIEFLVSTLLELDKSPDSAVVAVSAHLPGSRIAAGIRVASELLAISSGRGLWAIVENQAALLFRLAGNDKEALRCYLKCVESDLPSIRPLGIASGLVCALSTANPYESRHFWRLMSESDCCAESQAALRNVLTAMTVRGQPFRCNANSASEEYDFVMSTASTLREPSGRLYV